MRKTIMRDLVTESLILDLLEWLLEKDRTYEKDIGAWRTSCPSLPDWEEANDRGLVSIEQGQERSVVRATPSGLSLLRQFMLPCNADMVKSDCWSYSDL